MKLTLSVIKADVGSIGGHTKPSDRMMDAVRSDVRQAISKGLIIDGFVSHTGDDIAILMSHTRGPDDTDVHQFAWDSFIGATGIAQDIGSLRRRPGPPRRRPVQQCPGCRPRRRRA